MNTLDKQKTSTVPTVLPVRRKFALDRKSVEVIKSLLRAHGATA